MEDGRHELVDVHAHFLTDEYVAAARAAGIERPDGMPRWPSWSLDDQLEGMRRRGIRRAILTISSPGVHFGHDARARDLAEQVNDAAAELIRKHPDDFGFFASLPLPDVDGAVHELSRAFELGAAGVTVESNAAGRYLGDPSLEPVWAELDRRRAVLFMHPTSPVEWQHLALGRPSPMLEFMFETTRTITDLVLSGVPDRYPNVKIVVPHSGAALTILSDRIQFFMDAFGLGAGTSSWAESMSSLWFDMAGSPFPRQMPFLTEMVGLRHILYGSDSCFTPSPLVDRQIASIDAADAPAGAASWRALTTANAAALLDTLVEAGERAEVGP